MNYASLFLLVFWVVAAVSTLWPAKPSPDSSTGGKGAPRISSRPVLDRYEEALRSLRTPAAMSFAYTIEQAGLRNIDQTHRVFRQGTLERDELLSVAGRRSSHPVVFIAHDRPDHYALGNLAPTRTHYEFLPLGTRRTPKRVDYVYRTVPKTAVPFYVTSVVIDGTSLLPRTIVFRAEADGVIGEGRVEYARVDRYWVPIAATAMAKSAGVPTRERMTFAGYQFPAQLPAATFAEPDTPSAEVISPPSISRTPASARAPSAPFAGHAPYTSRPARSVTPAAPPVTPIPVPAVTGTAVPPHAVPTATAVPYSAPAPTSTPTVNPVP